MLAFLCCSNTKTNVTMMISAFFYPKKIYDMSSKHLNSNRIQIAKEKGLNKKRKEKTEGKNRGRPTWANLGWPGAQEPQLHLSSALWPHWAKPTRAKQPTAENNSRKRKKKKGGCAPDMIRSHAVALHT